MEALCKMELIHANGLDHKTINKMIRDIPDRCAVDGCCGQRFIGAGMSGREIEIRGIPGNALGAYLNGGTITVRANAQDAVGDTMNEGTIVIHGNAGDATGYAMRGGKIFVKGNAGYRAGIHMKAYEEKIPVMVIGGKAGSFLGEYQAGGIIAVLNLQTPEEKIVGNFPCTGMHGGTMFLRSDCRDIIFPEQVTARPASPEDLQLLSPYVAEFCGLFGYNVPEVMSGPFTVVSPDSKNPYKQMYEPN